jgi:hypothetical protein
MGDCLPVNQIDRRHHFVILDRAKLLHPARSIFEPILYGSARLAVFRLAQLGWPSQLG